MLLVLPRNHPWQKLQVMLQLVHNEEVEKIHEEVEKIHEEVEKIHEEVEKIQKK
jgi:predicted transcriptional regulator